MLQATQMIQFQAENGETITAPVGMWIMAIMAQMPEEQKNKIHETVSNMMKEMQQRSLIVPPPAPQAAVRVDEEGRRHFSMKADTGLYNIKGNGKKH